MNIIRKNGVPAKLKAMNFKHICSRKDLVVMYEEEFLSLKDIAEILDCSKSTIYRRLISFNIPRRDIYELRWRPERKVPCLKCGKPKVFAPKYAICKDCWAEEHGRERRASGRLVSLGCVLIKRKFEICKNCEGWIATFNKSGYCVKCRRLPAIKKIISPKFCVICEKEISSSNLSGLCPDCSNKQRSTKTIFKRKEAVKIFKRALSDLNVEGKTKDEAMIAFMNLLKRRFFFGYTGNVESHLQRRNE